MNGTAASAQGKDRARLVAMLDGRLRSREQIVAIFPYTNTKGRPKVPGQTRADRVTEGVWQWTRRYRPLVLTDQRLIVFDTGRQYYPRSLLAEYPVEDIELVEVTPGRMGVTNFVLELPGVGRVPFASGRKEEADLEVLVAALGRPPSGGC